MPRWCHGLLAVWFAGFMVVGITTEGQAQRQSNDLSSSEPEYFEFGEGHAYMGSDRFVSEHGKLVFVRRIADMTGRGTFRETSEKLDPPQEAWDRFWKEIDSAGVWQWQASYKSGRSSETDGSSWSLEARHANRQVKSQGYNAVPATYSEFRSAVYRLLDAARRKQAASTNLQLERHSP
jgi:hypothetical protein